jgi:hypothetical protein
MKENDPETENKSDEDKENSNTSKKGKHVDGKDTEAAIVIRRKSGKREKCNGKSS